MQARFSRFLSLVVAAFLLGSSLLLSGCLVTDKEGTAMQEDIVALKQQLKTVNDEFLITRDRQGTSLNKLERDFEQVKKATQYTSASGTVELDRVKRDILMLNGMVEQNGFKLDKNQQAVQQKLDELEMRLAVIETKLGIDPKKYAPVKNQTSQTTAALIVPEKPKEPVKAADPSDPKDLFRQGVKLIKDNENVEGRKLMAIFLKQYKGGRLADDAQYWIGKSYFQQKNYHHAVMEFQKIGDKYPQGDMVDESLFMMGECLRKLGLKSDAKPFYQELVEKFPNSKLAPKAKKILKLL